MFLCYILEKQVIHPSGNRDLYYGTIKNIRLLFFFKWIFLTSVCLFNLHRHALISVFLCSVISAVLCSNIHSNDGKATFDLLWRCQPPQKLTPQHWNRSSGGTNSEDSSVVQLQGWWRSDASVGIVIRSLSNLLVLRSSPWFKHRRCVIAANRKNSTLG